MRLREFTPFLPAVTFGVVARAHDDVVELDSLVDALSLERLLPRFTFLHLEFGDLVGVNESVVLLSSSFVVLAIALAFPAILLLWVVLFAGCWLGRNFLMEVGWEDDIESME